MSLLQKHLDSVSERFDEKFEGFYDLIPTEDNGYTSSEITHYEELKSFLLQDNKRVIELVVEFLTNYHFVESMQFRDGADDVWILKKDYEKIISELTSAIKE